MGLMNSSSSLVFLDMTPMLSGFNVECTPNMDSNEIVWNNADCIDIGTNICHHLDLFILLPDPTFITSLNGIPLAHKLFTCPIKFFCNTSRFKVPSRI